MLLGALIALLLLLAYIYWCVWVRSCRNEHLLAKAEYPCCCSACSGSELVGGLLEEALPEPHCLSTGGVIFGTVT